MTTMIIELYEALKAAGAPEDKARDAAKAVEGVRESERLRAIEERLTRFEERTEGNFAKLEERTEGRFRLLQWMVGFLLAVGLTNLGLLIHLIIRVGTGGS
jgi:hypothetical protein